MIDSTYEDKLYQTLKFAGAFQYNWQKNRATLLSPGDLLLPYGQFTLCRACAEQPVCVAVIYL